MIFHRLLVYSTIMKETWICWVLVLGDVRIPTAFTIPGNNYLLFPCCSSAIIIRKVYGK